MVSFTSAGFNHIRYKKGGVARDRASQMERFKLLPKAFELISLTTTYQEYEEVPGCIYWGLIAILDSKKIKVVVRKKNSGQAHFLSIIPEWITSGKRDRAFFQNHL